MKNNGNKVGYVFWNHMGKPIKMFTEELRISIKVEGWSPTGIEFSKADRYEIGRPQKIKGYVCRLLDNDK